LTSSRVAIEKHAAAPQKPDGTEDFLLCKRAPPLIPSNSILASSKAKSANTRFLPCPHCKKIGEWAMKGMIAVMILVLVTSAAALAEDSELKTGSISANFNKFVSATELSYTPSNFEGTKRFDSEKFEKVAFYTSLTAFWATTALDIYSGKQLDQTRYHETSPLGPCKGQIIFSGAMTGVSLLTRHYSKGKSKWLVSALLAAGSARKAYPASHNLGLD